jgi:myo-inositol catabolism protein IolS
MIDFSHMSRLAFGCDPLGGHNWGNVDPKAIADAIPHAIDRGITLFDTADCYGDGQSEERLGKALGRRRNEVLVASKFGVRIGNDGKVFIDNDPAWIRQAVEGSLKRLGTDVIDLYQLHWWDGRTPFAEIFYTLQRLVEAGRIRAFGSTNVTLETMKLNSTDELPTGYRSSSMEFSLVHGTHRAAIETMCGPDGEHKPHFLAWGSLGGGILTGKYVAPSDLDPSDRRLKRADSHFRGERLKENLSIVAICREIAARHGEHAKVSQVALQWIGRTLGFGTCLVGIKSRAQLDDALASWDFQLSDEDVRRLDRVAHR